MCQRKVAVILVVLSTPGTIPGEPCPALHRQTDCPGQAVAGKGLAGAGRCQAAGPCFQQETWSNLPKFSPHSTYACRAGSTKQSTLEKSPSCLLPVPTPACCQAHCLPGA